MAAYYGATNATTTTYYCSSTNATGSWSVGEYWEVWLGEDFKQDLKRAADRVRSVLNESLRIASQLHPKRMSIGIQRAVKRCFHRKQPPGRFAFYQGAF